tara:strand:- start:191 stop:550 length:360 start_codon:yes stop_codon:yes gene_type:complete
MRKKAMRNVSIMTELSTEKVELNAANLKKKTNEINSFLKNYRNLAKEVIKASQIIKDAKKLNDEGYSLEQSGTKIAVDVLKAADDLGVKPSNIPSFDEYSKASRELGDLNNQILKELPR